MGTQRHNPRQYSMGTQRHPQHHFRKQMALSPLELSPLELRERVCAPIYLNYFGELNRVTLSKKLLRYIESKFL
jgi:hypothetical protein